MDESYIAAYGGRDALLDLSTQSSVLDLSAMDAKVLDTGKVGGALVGAPIGVALFSVGVNPELLKQAGLAMPDDKTWTWDDLAPWPRRVTEKLGSQGVVGMDFFGAGAAETRCLGSAARPGGVPTEGQAAVTPETLVSYFEFAKQMVDTKATPPAGTQVENTTRALDAIAVRHEQGGVPPAVPHPDLPPSAPPAARDLQLLRGCPRRCRVSRRRWSTRRRCTGRCPAAASTRRRRPSWSSFLMTDPAATKVLTIERGVPAIPAVQPEIEPVLDATGKIVVDVRQTIAGRRWFRRRR